MSKKSSAKRGHRRNTMAPLRTSDGSLPSKARGLSAEKRAAERETPEYREKNGEFRKYRDVTSPFYGQPLPVTVAEIPSEAPRKPLRTL